MGTYKIDKCIFTDLPTLNIESELDGIEYFVKFDEHRIKIILPYDAISWQSNYPWFRNNRHILSGFLYNNIWDLDQNKLISLRDIDGLLQTHSYPKNPQEKADNLLIGLYEMQTEEGESVDLEKLFLVKKKWTKYYFKSYSEANFYLKHLQKQNLIDATNGNHITLGAIITFASVSFYGLSHIIKLHDEGEKSKNCFIAMAFSEETKQIRKAIKKAVEDCGYQPIIIDEQHIQSDKTINDEIIASLKRSKFCIADFTLHRNGVYFESGFALGQGKKVIYTCREDEFSKAHFDIKPLQHIIYSTPDELLKLLTFKIQAFID